MDKSALTLAEVCALILNENMHDEQIRTTIFSKIPRDKLEKSIVTIHEFARLYGHNFHDEMVEQYGRVRHFLPRLLRDIEFKAAPAGQEWQANRIQVCRSLGHRSQPKEAINVLVSQLDTTYKQVISKFNENKSV